MVQLRTLGMLEIASSCESDVGASLTQPKRLALLVYLAAAKPRGFHRRDTLLALFWPELDEQHARGALSQALLHLRSVLGDGVVITRGTNEVGIDSTRLWCDACVFETSSADGEQEHAIELYRGDFLEGVHLPGQPEFERWVETERTRYRAIAAGAAWALAEQEENDGHEANAGMWARTAVSLTSDNELAVRRQIELLARVGDQAGAIAAYEEFARRLETDYEAEPSAETRAVIEGIRSRGIDDDSARLSVQSRNQNPKPQRISVASLDERAKYAVHRPAHDRYQRAGLRPNSTRRAVAAVGILVGFGLFGLIAVLGARHSSKAHTGASGAPVRIAVFPFTYRGSEQFAYLGEGMVDLLSVAFDGAGDLRRVDPSALLSVVKQEPQRLIDPERARAIASRFNVDLFVLGTVTSVDNKLVLSATLYDARTNLESMRVAERRGAASALPSLVDALATELLRKRLQTDSRGAAQQAVIATRTTASLPALKAYLTGERFLRTAQYDDAARAYEAAIAADSNFALAYVRLAVALSDGAQSSLGWSMLDAINRATNHSAGLAQRDRAVLNAVDAFWSRRDPNEAIRVLRGVVQEYPDDFEAWSRLGEMEFHHGMRSGRPLDEVRTALLRSSELDSANSVLIERRWLANVEDNKAEDERLSLRMLTQAPDGDFRHLLQVNVALFRGDHEAVLRTIEAVRPLRALVRLLFVEQVAMHSDDIELVRKAATLLTSQENTSGYRVAGHKIMAHVEAARGHWGAAKAELLEIEALDRPAALQTLGILSLSPAAPQSAVELGNLRLRLTAWRPVSIADSIRRLYLLGLLAGRSDHHGDAQSIARALESRAHRLQLRDSWSRLGAEARDRALSVRAQSAWLRGDSKDALRYLEMTRPETWWGAIANGDLFDNWVYERFMRAEVLRHLGREQEATNWYSALRLTQYELVFEPIVNLRLGELAERRGDRITAAGHYAKVIAKWAGVDPNLQAYDGDARVGLSRLRLGVARNAIPPLVLR